MSTFLLMAILVGMLGVAIMIIYVIDKIHSIENHARRSTGNAGASKPQVAPDDRFSGLEGQLLWQTMIGAPMEGWDQEALDALRLCYEPVLLRHIGELLEEGVLDGRQGIQVKPDDLRTIKTTHGQVVSWIPPEEARAIYDLGLKQQRAGHDALPAIRARLDETCDRLFASLGLVASQSVSRILLPGAEPASATDALTAAVPAPSVAAPFSPPVAPPVAPLVALEALGADSAQNVATPLAAPAASEAR